METTIVDGVAKASAGLGMVEPFDGRQSLKKNPRGKKWKTRDVDTLSGMVWHQELGWGSVEGVAEYHTGNDSHLHAGGVESIAYTFAIRRNGQIVLCNDFDRAVWSQGFKGRSGDENAEFMSVMFEGLFSGPGVTDPTAGEPNDEQMLSALMLWRICKKAWDWNEEDLYGHYHFGKPACPGDTIGTLIESVRANLEEPEYDFGTVEGRQQALKDLGYYAGAVDGVWGPRSRGALIRFQDEHELVADGIWGARTEAAMVVAQRPD
jgi:hypothetical protein